jgi:uridine kinase
MAVRVLLDHGVREEHIIFVTFLVAKDRGVQVIKRAFPSVKIVAGAVDDFMVEGSVLREDGRGNRKVWAIQPGIGHIGELMNIDYYA